MRGHGMPVPIPVARHRHSGIGHRAKPVKSGPASLSHTYQSYVYHNFVLLQGYIYAATLVLTVPLAYEHVVTGLEPCTESTAHAVDIASIPQTS